MLDKAERNMNEFFRTGAADRIAEHLRGDTFRAQEPEDKKSSEWLLWYLVENRKKMYAQLIDALKVKGAQKGNFSLGDIKRELKPIIDQANRAESDKKIISAIDALDDTIAQAVLRLCIEVNYSIAEVCADSLDVNAAGHESHGSRLLGLYRQFRTVGREKMSKVVPASSGSDTLKKTGLMIIQVMKECGM